MNPAPHSPLYDKQHQEEWEQMSDIYIQELITKYMKRKFIHTDITGMEFQFDGDHCDITVHVKWKVSKRTRTYRFQYSHSNDTMSIWMREENDFKVECSSWRDYIKSLEDDDTRN